jgi:hypothetical protein
MSAFGGNVRLVDVPCFRALQQPPAWSGMWTMMYAKWYIFGGIVGRGKNTGQAAKTLATSEARRDLPRLVKGMGAKRKPSASLLDDAVSIGPHRKGGAFLVPEVDALAHAGRIDELEAELEARTDDLEDLGLALFVQDRLETTSGKRLSLEEFARGIGMEGFLDELSRE